MLGSGIANASVGILEAYACCLPVIICKKAVEYYEPIGDSFIVENNDFFDAVNKVEYIIDNKQSIHHHRKKAKIIANKHDYKSIAMNILNKI